MPPYNPRQRSSSTFSIWFNLFAVLALCACGNDDGGGSSGQGGQGGSGGQANTGGAGGSGGQGSNLCTQTGGTESMALCCTSSGDFPDSCLTGACGCSPQNSHMVKVCNCPAGQCFDAAMGCK